MGKRLLSARNPLPSSATSTTTSSAEPQQQIKRVNSKEELVEEPSSGRDETVRKISSSVEFEETMKETKTQEVALKALTVAHCAESLACLIDLFKWEKEDDETKRRELFDKICNEYLKKGEKNEIFLPDTLREKVVSGKETLLKVKNHVLNDLRFNTALLKAIGAA